jgi:nitrogen fixation protein
LPLFVLDKRIEENFVVMVNSEHLKRLINSRNGGILFFHDLPEVTSHLGLLGLSILVVLGRLLCLILDLVEEVDEALCIGG